MNNLVHIFSLQDSYSRSEDLYAKQFNLVHYALVTQWIFRPWAGVPPMKLAEKSGGCRGGG